MTTATQIQLRRGTAAQIAVFTPAAGELVADMTNFRTVLGDGAAVGGKPPGVGSIRGLVYCRADIRTSRELRCVDVK